ncbi:MAG: type III-B CRISPR module RAMP protein Cmr4 [Myxococcota bacterium]
METKLLLVHALSPLHAGIGQGMGVIDLPIAREKGTHFPYLPGSSLKGVLREACNAELKSENKPDEKEPRSSEITKSLFGPESQEAHEHAGALVFSDQRLLLFPVRALQGVFAWVTCPLVLERFARDLGELKAGAESLKSLQVPKVVSSEHLLIATDTVLRHKDNVYLEDLDLKVQAEPDSKTNSVNRWADALGPMLFPEGSHKASAWQTQLRQRLCVVHDDVFAFLVETATEINARIRLEPKTKTVAKGGLWYEENLPAETVLSGFVTFLPNDKTLRQDKTKMSVADAWGYLGKLTLSPRQLGGKATVGRGLCHLRFKH